MFGFFFNSNVTSAKLEKVQGAHGEVGGRDLKGSEIQLGNPIANAAGGKWEQSLPVVAEALNPAWTERILGEGGGTPEGKTRPLCGGCKANQQTLCRLEEARSRKLGVYLSTGGGANLHPDCAHDS